MMDLRERNVIEITKADLQRMRGSPPRDHYAKFMKEKLKLKAISDERANRWPNTIKALHQKRIQEKREKQEKLERDRLELDALEAKFKAQRRNEMINKANMMLLLPHITHLLSRRQVENIAKEREAQIKYKEKVHEAMERQERKWVQLQKEELMKWEKEKQMEIEKKKESRRALVQAQLSQLRENEEKLKEKKRKMELEKEYLKQLEEEDRLLEEEKERLKQQRIKEMNEEMIKENDAQKARKEEEILRMKHLDKEIEEFSIKKEKMMDERIQNEKLRTLLKSKQRSAISEKLYEEMLASNVNMEKVLEREENKKKFEDEKNEAMRIQRNKESWNACDRSRKLQIMRKNEQAMRDAIDEKYEAEKSWECAWRCRMDAEIEQREKYLIDKSIVDHNQKIAAYNKQRMIEEALQNKEEERAAIQRMEFEYEKEKEISLDQIKL